LSPSPTQSDDFTIIRARIACQGANIRQQLILIKTYQEALQAIADAGCDKTSPIAKAVLKSEISNIKS
jgi:hypothetical protein